MMHGGTRAIRYILLVVLPAVAPAGRPQVIDVPLHIRDVAGVERKQDIVGTGVPLPPGAARDAAGFTVTDPGGKAVPAQFRVLERWRDAGAGRGDRSVKWLLVTFPADVPAGGEAQYRLQRGRNPAPVHPARPVEDLAPLTLILTRADGAVVTDRDAGAPERTVWEEGPVRACARFETACDDDGFGYIAWVWTYAGLPRVDATIVLKNTPRDPAGPLYFKDFTVAVAPPGLRGAGRGLIGVEDGAETVTAPAQLYQDSGGGEEWETLEKWNNAFVVPWSKIKEQGRPSFRGYTVFEGGVEKGRGNGAPGWAALNGDETNALVALRHFRANNPKAVEIEQGRLLVRLWPRYWQGHGGNHWLDDAQRKAHDITIRTADCPWTAAAGDAAARGFDKCLVAHCGADWYRQAGVCRPQPRRYPYRVNIESKKYDRHMGRNWLTIGADVSDRIRRRYHQETAVAFMATANPHAAYVLRLCARSSAGVTPLWIDNYRYPRDRDMLVHTHYCTAARDVGSYRPGTAHHGYTPWNHAHFTCEELFDAWRLFGDPLALDAIEKVGAYCQSYVDFREGAGKDTLVAGTRADGLPYKNLCEVFRITGDESMLRSLERFADVVWRQVDKKRGNYGVMDKWEGGSERVEKPFMMKQVMDGMKHYYTLTGDERTLDQLIGMHDFIRREAWIGRWGFTYVVKMDPGRAEPYRRQQFAKFDAEKKHVRYGHIGPSFSWLYRHTGVKRFREVADSLDTRAYPHTDFRYAALYDEKRDPAPPDAIGDLRCAAAGKGTVTLRWTTPPDAVRIQVKWAAKPLVVDCWPDARDTKTNWWAARQVRGEPAAAGGKSQAVVVKDLPPGNKYFAACTFDDEDNRSALSNQVAVEVP